MKGGLTFTTDKEGRVKHAYYAANAGLGRKDYRAQRTKRYFPQLAKRRKEQVLRRDAEHGT